MIYSLRCFITQKVIKVKASPKHDMWLSPEILEWRVLESGSTVFDETLRARAHEIWGHAEQVLSHPTSAPLRVDAITTLKRAIAHRVRLLENLYSLRSIPLKDKPSDTLKLLEFLGVVRPLMLDKLIAIRNAVEHDDAPPPDIETCQVFLEFAWYFLRSTDSMARVVVDSVELKPSNEDEDYWLNVESGLGHNWIPKLTGWLTPEMLSTQPKDQWLALKVENK